jgi:hypothetical protein
MSATLTESESEGPAAELSRGPSWWERLLLKGHSRAVELEESILDPFPAPKAWGQTRWLWDETMPSLMLTGLTMLVTLALLLLASALTIPPSKLGIEEIEIVQVELGTGSQIGSGGEAGADQANLPEPQQTEVQATSSEASSVLGNVVTQDFRPTGQVQQVDPAAAFTASPQRAQRMRSILDELEKAGNSIVDLGKGGTIAGVFKVDKSVKSVVYVVDRSGSMGSNQALERVKAELLYAVRNLSDEQRFSVIFFDHAIYPLGSEQPVGGTTTLVSADSQWKKKTEDFCNTIYPAGGTDPREAMRLAMSLNPEVIYLLSDGEFNPSCVNEITSVNQKKSPPVKINCVGLGEVIVTLHEIAKQNGGVYFQAR